MFTLTSLITPGLLHRQIPQITTAKMDATTTGDQNLVADQSNDTGDHLSPPQPLSKNAQKKLLKQQRFEAKKAEKKAAEKAEKKRQGERKRREWEEKLSSLSEEEKLKMIEARKGMRKERMDQRTEERESKALRLSEAKKNGQNIVIDLQFSDLMAPNEIHSLVNQGGSGVGFGNFGEIGPLDVNLKPRNSTWLHKADLIFVDSPVGTGFSYVEDDDLFVKTDVDAATDLTTLLKAIYNKNTTLQKSPLYIFAESYGGKFAVTLGLSVLQAIKESQLKLQLGGIALGDSWISPEDFVLSWGPLLKDVSRIDEVGLNQSNSLALKIQQQLGDGQYEAATNSWSELEGVILVNSNNVDFYNFMLDEGDSPVIAKTKAWRQLGKKPYAMISETNGPDLGSVMNGPIREKLKIIPANVTWGGQSDDVFSAMVGDFMKPRIAEVDELLLAGVNVTVYNGQVDLICATKGTESWINKLKWDGLSTYLSLGRTPLYCGKDVSTTKGFFRSYKNFAFYWILGAGHFVPVEQPCVSLEMVGRIVNSPNKH